MRVQQFILTLLSSTILAANLLIVNAFTTNPTVVGYLSNARYFSSKTALASTKSESFLLDDFKLSNGELLDPYKTLKVSRSASKPDIKKSYYMMSRRYHPDGVRHRDILPGSCNNLDEVRDHWERIRMSYEILRNDKLRKRYDRHEALADPGAALQRAAMDATMNSVVGVGKGIFNIGAFAVTSIIKRTTPKKEQKSTV